MSVTVRQLLQVALASRSEYVEDLFMHEIRNTSITTDSEWRQVPGEEDQDNVSREFNLIFCCNVYN